MSQNEISFPDAKSSCMKKTKANPKAKNVQTRRLALFVIQRGANAKAKKLKRFRKGFRNIPETHI